VGHFATIDARQTCDYVAEYKTARLAYDTWLMPIVTLEQSDTGLSARPTFQVARIRVLLLSTLLGITSSFCHGETHDVVCSEGYGKFEVTFRTGVTVSVGAERSDSLEKRSCEAKLTWDKQTLPVVSDAFQADIDLLGVDLGLGTPVVAFQIKKSDGDRSLEYQIYSLQKPPQLLRIIKGGDFFSAADTDLQGSVEIWTTDASAVYGLENMSLIEFGFAPTMVLQFEKRRLVDVSSEFRPYFDRQISEVKAHLDSQELVDFKNSNGKLAVESSSNVEQLHRLRTTKIKVLEIVWCYLYSGREQEAWQNLAEMWPPADLERIRVSLLDARDHGITSQVDSVSERTSRSHRSTTPIYDVPTDKEEAPSGSSAINFIVDDPPQVILLQRPPPNNAQQALTKAEEKVDLVIDAAGKVRSAKVFGEGEPDLSDAYPNWKFIPAFRNGHAVASRLRLTTWFLR
jgi:hypothetical protein